MSAYEQILTETHGAVTLITLNRPQALNALNAAVLEELITAFAAYEADPGQRCAVLTGAGEKAFAAGADIKEMAEKPAADFYAQDFFSRWTSHLVKATRKPWLQLGGRGGIRSMAGYCRCGRVRRIQTTFGETPHGLDRHQRAGPDFSPRPHGQ